MKLVNAYSNANIRGQNILRGKTNYFCGNDKNKWQRGIANFKSVKYSNVYPGIGLYYYGNQKRIEYDFVVSPGADPENIKLVLEGPEHIELDKEGNLIMQVGPETMRFKAPIVYQEIGGRKNPIKGEFTLLQNNQIGFKVGDYDHRFALVIDPVLIYSTYIGGNGQDTAYRIHVDDDGNMLMLIRYM